MKVVSGTFQEQQQFELEVRNRLRRSWLQYHAVQYDHQVVMSEALGLSPVRLRQIAKELGVTLPKARPGRKKGSV